MTVDRVEEILDGLTPEEKAAQLTFRTLPPDGRLDDAALQPPPGFVTVPAAHWRDSAARVSALQEQLTAPGTTGIPAVVVTVRTWSGAVHFPDGLARAAAWDQVLVEDIAAASAFEARAGGATARLGPVLATITGPYPTATVDRDQCLGGDPVLTAELVAAHVRGSHGRVPGRIRRDGAAVVLTHLGAMASQLAGTPADGHERWLRDHVLAGAEAGVSAGAAIVIPTSSANAAVPGHTDSWLLRDVLRREWGFDGVVLAATGALEGLVAEHRVAPDVDTAYALALESGVDVVRTDTAGPSRLAALLAQGRLPRWLLDDAVRAVLRLKTALGLFEDAGPVAPDGRVGGRAHREIARRAVVESTVLLADSGHALPLAGVTAVDVLCADRPAGMVPDTARLARALAVALPDSVVRDRGGAAAAEQTDLAGTVVVVVVDDPGRAATTVSRIVATGRRCVALVCSGEIDTAPQLASTTAAVLLCWRPIADHADGLAEVLVGTAEPGGRLPLALDGGGRYPLGHGRGYTTFEYSQLQVSPDPSSGTEPLSVQLRLTNTGHRPGKEVVQVYVHDHVGSVRRHPRRLAGFVPVRLGPGQSRRVRIPLPPSRLAVWDRTMRRVVEPGEFDVLVGRSATDIRLTARITVHSGGAATVPAPRRT